jgi:LmbE family N-acetylglucosaminyl deacetylase/SAM-dependent methyltransferase
MDNVLDKEVFRAGAVQIEGSTIEKIRRCLLLVPHPDDEALGCAGLLKELVKQGSEIRIVLTTDGSRSHSNSPSYPPARLAALRKEELIAALNLLGIAASQLICYDATDSAMPAKNEPGFEELTDRLSDDLILFQPDLILVPYELDPHRDHRATWQVLIAALEKVRPAERPKIWEYPIWLYENAGDGDIPDLKAGELLSLDTTAYTELKRQCIFAHRSQTTRLIEDDPTGFILTPDMIANFTNGKEYFMERARLNPSATLSRDYFETLYTGSDDPWSFETSEYELSKYVATVNAIPAGVYYSGLELGCSIGVLTEMLSQKCKELTAMDISEVALERAKKRLEERPSVRFILGGIPDDFPAGEHDLIIISEVGYYLSKADLLTLRKQVTASLSDNGVLVLVHWTHFVKDYPLTGDQVHECFAETSLYHLEGSRTDDYRLDVYKKRAQGEEI